MKKFTFIILISIFLLSSCSQEQSNLWKKTWQDNVNDYNDTSSWDYNAVEEWYLLPKNNEGSLSSEAGSEQWWSAENKDIAPRWDDPINW